MKVLKVFERKQSVRGLLAVWLMLGYANFVRIRTSSD